MLPSYVEEMNLPGFGLLDRGPPVPLMTVRQQSLGGGGVVLGCPRTLVTGWISGIFHPQGIQTIYK